MSKLPRWVWTLLLLLTLPGVVMLLALRQPTRDDVLRQSQALAQAGDVDSAIALLDAALVQQPSDPALYVARGQRILLLYEWDRARADFDRALDLDPTYADGYFHRGVLLSSVPDASVRPNAVSDFESYLRLAPDGEYADEARRFIQSLRPPTSG